VCCRFWIWLGFWILVGGRRGMCGHFKKVCVLSLREGVLFVVVERVEELVVFPREGTEEKMFCCSVCFLIFLSASWYVCFFPPREEWDTYL